MVVATSLSPPSRLPRGMNSIVDVLRWRASDQRDALAFTFLIDGEQEEERLTYGELDGRASAIAVELISARATGCRALLVYDSGLDYIAAIYGCLYAGVTAVPVYPPDPFRIDRTLPRLCSIVADAGATWLLATQATLDWARPLFRSVPGLASSMATDRLFDNATNGDRRIRQNSYPFLRSDQTSHEVGYAQAGHLQRTPALLQYTSGSTGTPRGVTISHANLLSNLRSIDAALDREGNVAVLWLPAYHDMGLIGGVFQPVYSGRSAVLMSPVSFMQRPVRWLNAISRYRGTITAAPNFAYELCVRKVTAQERASLDLSCLLAALNGAEMVRPETLDRFAGTFAECGFRREAFHPCYGLAEATLMVAGGAVGEMPVVRSFAADALQQKRAVPTSDDDPRAWKLVGCGRAAAGQRIVIAGPETCSRLDDGEVGEIWVAGDSIGQGYWNRPEESAAVFQSVLSDGDGPFLRTGDLGFIDDGELFVAGRSKELIILQGRNHFPHDIEETVWRCDPLLKSDGGAAFSIDLGGEERLAVVQEVLRPRKADLEAVVERIRAQVAEVHDAAPAVVALIAAGTLPKTSSGKKQRRACRDQLLAGELATLAEWRDERLFANHQAAKLVAVAPRSDMEKSLALIWSDVLGTDIADVHASFFDLGGQSLLAGQLAARIQDKFAIELPLRTLFSNPTITSLATWLDYSQSKKSDSLPFVVHADRSQPLPLSSAQEQLWFLEQLESQPRYNLTASIRLSGELDIEALQRSLTTIVSRHEVLRTTFVSRNGRLQQVVASGAAPTLDLAEKEGVEKDRVETDGDSTDRQLGINPAAGPLLHAKLCRLSQREHRLTITAHHLICDGWSLAIFLKELAALYADELSRQRARLDEIVWQYADFAAWQQACLATPQMARQLEYWKGQLECISPLNLATDYARSAEGKFRGQAVGCTLDKAMTDALQDLAHRDGATLYMVLLAAFQTLLARYSRQQDICVGSPVSYRPRREFEHTIGYFVNILALRSNLSGEPSFRNLLAQVRETVLDALANSDAPLQCVVDAVAPRREAGRSPLFDCMFVFENLPWRAAQAGGLSFGEIEIDHRRIGSFDLGLVVEEQAASLKMSLVYNAELFDRGTIEHMQMAFQRLLTGIVANPDCSVTHIPLVDESTKAKERESGTDGQISRVEELIADRARMQPDATAIVGSHGSMSYRQLDEQANQLAHHLQALGVGPDLPVAIFLDRSMELVVAMLAVMKAGGAYVPFDAHEAAGRLSAMLSDTQPRAIITSADLTERLPPHKAEEICLDGDEHDISRHPMTAPNGEDGLPRPSRAASRQGDRLNGPSSSDDLAYIIYTSGSTGRPKGVEITHAPLANLVAAMADQYGLTADDRVLQLISPAFDVAAEEIFPTLLRGAMLVLGPPTVELTGRAILDVCRQQRVTVAHIPPQLWQQCLREWQPADESLFTHLRVLVIGGEAPPAEALNRWLEVSRGQVRTLHEFGLTETTVTNLVYELPMQLAIWPVGRKLPVGKPVAGSEIYVLDTHQRPVPIGAPGELYIGGPGVARGYHRLPEATAERFIELPFETTGTLTSGTRLRVARRVCRTGDLARWLPDGNLEFLGRIDEQIKLRGLRIEPGEVERVLAQHPAIGEAAVVAREESPGRRRLVAYLVPANGHVPDREELRAWLRGKLPDSMVPSAVVRLDRLPLNRSHKLDRDRLPMPPADADQRGYTGPRNDVEQLLAEIWQQVLKLDRVGVHDNFFELGGDSILTIQVISRARESGLRFAPRQIFDCQTIAELAAVEGVAGAPIAEQGIVEGNVPLTPIQHWFLSGQVVDPHHFNQSVLLHVDRALDARHLPQVLRRLVEHHDALRLRFARDPNGWRQWHAAPDDAWPMARFDLTALSAGERTAVLTAAAADLQGSLDLERGPLARAAWFDLGSGDARLLLIIHHLVVDAVSWKSILEDLGMLWTQLQRGENASLPPKTSSFKHWSERLARFADDFEVQAELATWSALDNHHPPQVPRDFYTDQANLYGDSDVVDRTWDAAKTADLLQHANGPYRTQTNEILLAALSQTLSKWAGDGTLIDVEGHGRGGLFEEVDLSRTVGWFTAWQPFVSPASNLPAGALLRQTKESLRQVPHQGIGYGVLRYLSSNADIRSVMSRLPQAEVSFNYLGRMDDYLPPALLEEADEVIGPTCSPRSVRRHLLEINSYVRGGRLHVEWTYNRCIHRRETIEKLAADFLERLNALLSHCLSPEAGGFTPSDFPLARVTASELDMLSSLLGD
jgi:amino acid adenylation domain-containing protein/non-ribosomal peptide synthase protein (TIGR01720 family)